MRSIGTYYNGWHTGHPRFEMMPWLYPGDIMCWSIPPYDLKLNPAESVEDATTVEIQCRKEIVAEIAFLKKYVPGFENANLAGISLMCGLREGRHPLGEYVYTWEDMVTPNTFEDCALRLLNRPGGPHGATSHDMSEWTTRKVTQEFPIRMFQAAGVDNLMLGGDNTSIHWTVYCLHKGFGIAMAFGEVSGMAAAKAIRENKKVRKSGSSLTPLT